MLGAIDASGWVATMAIESATDGDVFLAFLEHVLCQRLQPGNGVVDNLHAHKANSVLQLIEQRGARLHYLPAYSLDVNPIETLVEIQTTRPSRPGSFSGDASARRRRCPLRCHAAGHSRLFPTLLLSPTKIKVGEMLQGIS